ncbi:MAG: SHOCT domain-containing protein, partial [Micrococcaceae bacterium]|nr:SHOCT domain-containing protein [Micrococcaceae bacterium]
RIMGLFRTAGRAAVAGSVVGRVQRNQQQRFAAEDAAKVAAQPVETVAAAPVPAATVAMDLTDHKLAQLKQLGELRAAGVLTEDEFQGEKTKILAT